MSSVFHKTLWFCHKSRCHVVTVPVHFEDVYSVVYVFRSLRSKLPVFHTEYCKVTVLYPVGHKRFVRSTQPPYSFYWSLDLGEDHTSFVDRLEGGSLRRFIDLLCLTGTSDVNRHSRQSSVPTPLVFLRFFLVYLLNRSYLSPSCRLSTPIEEFPTSIQIKYTFYFTL